MVGLLTVHCHLKGQLFTLWKVPTKKMNQINVLCDCEAIAYLRFWHLGHYFMEPGDCHDATIRKVPCLIRNVGLVKGWSRRGSAIDHEDRSARTRWILACPIHTYMQQNPLRTLHARCHTGLCTVAHVLKHQNHWLHRSACCFLNCR
jgi:hypothetical protein